MVTGSSTKALALDSVPSKQRPVEPPRCQFAAASIRRWSPSEAADRAVLEGLTPAGQWCPAGVEITIARKTRTVCVTGSQAWRSIW